MTALQTKLIILVLTFANFCLAGGGSGGGVAPITTFKYVTVEVCDNDLFGGHCHLMAYPVRPTNPAQPDMCLFDNAGEEKPCAQIKTIPSAWFKNLGAATSESTEDVSSTNISYDSGGN
ncbi:MAG: hypothetical protein H7235_10585 [Bdellovibrionaceae bacterium]|nr:hypothetical protein [Pseudobdellovibrionaceae bacterium]